MDFVFFMLYVIIFVWLLWLAVDVPLVYGKTKTNCSEVKLSAGDGYHIRTLHCGQHQFVHPAKTSQGAAV